MKHSNIPMRKEMADHCKEVRKILSNGIPEEQIDHMCRDTKWAWLVWPFAIILCLLMLHGCGDVAHAYTEKEAIKTIVGEAANQGYIGMVCVGEVIRHNKRLNGFYGLKAMNHRHEPVWVWKMARRAWEASKNTNLTHMADHLENIHAFGEPYWVKSCVMTFKYMDHVFYRTIKKG